MIITYISILAKFEIYVKILNSHGGYKMSKKVQKIAVWTMLIVMVVGIIASYAAMFIVNK